VTPDEVCFLFSGKFEEKKHPVELVQAFGAAVNQGLRARLLMVGDGALKPQCETLIQQNNWPITLTGFINQGQIPEAYLASDCLVLPSDSGETWGLVVNEAMACGRPAIVSSLVGCREDLVEEETTGWSFRFGDWEQLQQLLWRAAQDPAHLHRMGLTARERIQKYSPLAAAEGIEQSLRSLASPRRQRSG
jgi:glycosyltransferase involved in cell wall biosynthesis